jgi:hypothetical protein
LCFVAVYLHFPVQFYVLFVFCCCLPSLPTTILRTVCVLLLFTFTSSTILRTVYTVSLRVQTLYCSYKQALIFRYINSNRPDHDQQHFYHHAPTVKPEAATAVVELLMRGVRTPETCWAVHKRQVINLRNCCIWLTDLLESTASFNN